jgi:hypothetical protein
LEASLKVSGPFSRVGSYEEGRRLCRVHCSPAGGKGSVYRVWGIGGEDRLHREDRCKTDEFPEVAPFELLSAGTRKALNASVPAEGRGEEIGDCRASLAMTCCRVSLTLICGGRQEPAWAEGEPKREGSRLGRITRACQGGVVNHMGIAAAGAGIIHQAGPDTDGGEGLFRQRSPARSGRATPRLRPDSAPLQSQFPSALRRTSHVAFRFQTGNDDGGVFEVFVTSPFLFKGCARRSRIHADAFCGLLWKYRVYG